MIRLPVTLLTGFLGSGKTTLLNSALKMPGMENTAVVVNELGSIGLDHLVMARASDNVVLLDAGCLCCALSDSLHETLADLAHRRARGEVPPFERVVIETSGVADPAPILNTLLGHPLIVESFSYDATVCTIDAQHFAASRTKYGELDKQAAVADSLVVTKADAVDEDDQTAVFCLLDALNPGAEVHVSTIGSPAFHVFLNHKKGTRQKIDLRGTPTAHNLERHGPGPSIRAFSFRPPVVTWAGWSAWSRLVAAEFGERLVRVKGLLKMQETNEVALVQGVQGKFHRPERFSDWPDADHSNRLVCIARDLDLRDIEASLAALSTAPCTQAVYSLREMREGTTQQ